MKICIQDTLLNPADYRIVDSSVLHLEPAKLVPLGGEAIDNRRGWYHSFCIQGIRFTSDHNHIRHLPDGCEITSWNDDPSDNQLDPLWTPEDPPEWWFRAHVVRFRELAPDPNLGGAINTNTTRILYAGKRVLEGWQNASPGGYDRLKLRPWEEFVPPNPAQTRHGIWVPDDLHSSHEAIQSEQSWRSWGDHLDFNELGIDGLVRPQYEQGRMSPPRGTITYFLRDTNQASGVHATDNIDRENIMSDTAGAGETEVSSNLSVGEDNLEFLFTTVANQPNSADWPDGLYECQTDCSSIGADISYGLLTLDASDGHFANVNAGLTTDNESWTQTQAVFTTAALNLASRNLNPASGNADDRFECLIAARRGGSCHGNQTFTLRYNSDAFARGPWTPPSAALPSLVMSPYKPT